MRLQVEILPSQQLALLFAMGHGGALFALLTTFSVRIDLLLAPVMLFSLYYFLLRDAWLRLPDSCVGLQSGPGEMVLVRRDGIRMPCSILGSSLVTPWLTVLNLLPQGARLARGIVLLPGSMEGESYRRLRIWLKWGEHVRGGSPSGAVHALHQDILE